MAMEPITTVNQMYAAMARATTAPMDDKLSHSFITLVMTEAQCESDPGQLAVIGERVKAEPTPIMQIVQGRLDMALPGRTWNPLFLILIDALAAGVPGDAVMWAAFAVGMVRDHKLTTVNSMTMMFPMGFPTQQAMSEIWRAQKCDMGNLIDQQAFWK